MKHSWKLGQIAGIEIRVHWTFLLLPAWIGLSSLSSGAGVAGALLAVALILAVFGCVALHELGHAMAARLFGIATRDITMLPIGGLARLERMPRNPFQELIIAVAGPAVNVALAVVLFLLLGLVGGLGQVFNLSLAGSNFLGHLLLANVVLVVFNMLPAFPMDGGRVLRSVLAMFMPHLKATKIAVGVGKAMAIGLGLIGLLVPGVSLSLILIAVFVFMAASAELRMAANADPAGFPAQDATGSWNREPQFGDFQSDHRTPWSGDGAAAAEAEVPPVTLPAYMRLSDALNAILKVRETSQFLVVQGNKALGIVTRRQLLDAVTRGYGNLHLVEWLQRSAFQA